MAWQERNNVKSNLAIVSPSQNAYSETFIQAHKHIPGVNVHFYYGKLFPSMHETKGALQSTLPRWKRVAANKLRRYSRSSFKDIGEDAFAWSLRKEKIDCVLAEYGITGARIYHVCKALKLPLLVHFHGYDASVHRILEQFEISYKDMFQYASAVIVVSKTMQKKIESLGCAPDKIIYNPYGPKEIFLDIEPSLGQKLFVSVGRFIDKKAPYYTILAFDQVLKVHPDARLVIAGEGPLFNACANLVRYLNIEHAVSLPGVITPDDFLGYLRVARAYVQHSITTLNGDMEGTPVSILEASAAGLPVVSTRHAGIPDVILDGETGLLVDEHDVEGMAAYMLFVLENFEKAKQIGMKGKQRIKEDFSIDKHLSILQNAIIDAINNKC
jgi:glycosyltransferase involved in cell wall biosynthesis